MPQIISQNTEWSSGSIHDLSGIVQIAPGVSLTIDPGAVVNGGSIQVFGTLNAQGTAQQNVIFNQVNLEIIGSPGSPGRIVIDHSQVEGGSFLAPTGNAVYGSFSLTNSTFKNVNGDAYVWYPTGNDVISGNLFDGFGGFSIGTAGPQVVISNNTFVNISPPYGPESPLGAVITAWATYDGGKVIVDHNNFYDVGKPTLALIFDGTRMTATNDYFGTTDPTILSSMIYDRNVDLRAGGYVDLSSVLPGPDPTAPSLCFCAGTRILTPSGERLVQELEVGDLVVTQGNEERQITWVGKGRVFTHDKHSAAATVIVRKNALADNVPHNDLHITKGHSLYLDRVLIPVEHMINYRSIIWDSRAQQVELYHIELADHDVLIANGAPAESYRDDGNRWLFQNCDITCDQESKPLYAPVLHGGTSVDEVWRRLMDRSGRRSPMSTTLWPDLHLLVDGRRLDGRVLRDEVYLFSFQQTPNEVRVVSRSSIPAALGLARDHRQLGVALRQIMLWQGPRLRLVDAAESCLDGEFHEFEQANGFRWTNGNARIPTPLFENVSGPFTLELHVAATMLSPLFPGQVDRLAA